MTNKYLFLMAFSFPLLSMGAGCAIQNTYDQTNASYRKYDNTGAQNSFVSSTTENSLPSLPTTCTDQEDGMPVITSLSSYSGPVGTTLEISGCNFAGFEGDLNAWIEDIDGVKGVLHSEVGSTEKLLKVVLKSKLCQKDISYSGLTCDASLVLVPGTYKIFVSPWGKTSNNVIFEIE
jgi:hypothetical protein